jgi:hypothetical protein
MLHVSQRVDYDNLWFADATDGTVKEPGTTRHRAGEYEMMGPSLAEDPVVFQNPLAQGDQGNIIIMHSLRPQSGF